ncbi:MAG: aminotransferase class III-fold pyridoxal phosphate-dependent enzyme [Woeseiaceae bacterium]|nr:aminotransferase class III-fold pyridoxal phosphate-dependent enzyme [Woeseiaceae bacterium]
MTTNQELLDIRVAEVPRGLGSQTTVFCESARNAEVFDVEGNRYIDLAAGIAVLNTGHNHPEVIAAVKQQLDKASHPCAQVTPYEVYVRLAERLNRLAPGDTPKKTVFLTTGAEAVPRADGQGRAL